MAVGNVGGRGGHVSPTPAPQIFEKQRQNLHLETLYLVFLLGNLHIFRPSAGPGWWIAVKRQKGLQSRKYYDKNI